MPIDIRKHPDAPAFDELDDIVVEPVPVEEIEARRADGAVLVEDNVRERDDLNVVAPMADKPGEEVEENIGVALYRLTQLFGTPQVPEYHAGRDISERTDEVFKYLLRANHRGDGDELPSEWLMTIHDSHVRLAASVAEWRDDGGESFTADNQLALTTLALAQRIALEPVECVYEDILY